MEEDRTKVEYHAEALLEPLKMCGGIYDKACYDPNLAILHQACQAGHAIERIDDSI